MKPGSGETLYEPAREVPVYGTCDVLVLGGGPGGTAAAIGAAAAGAEWKRSGRHADSIGLCPGVSQAYPTLEIPYGSLVPRELEGLLVAGRNLSCDVRSHNPLREVPECWVMGQGAGVGAALAVSPHRSPRGSAG